MSLWYQRNMKLVEQIKYDIEKQMMLGHAVEVDFKGILKVINSLIAENKRLDGDLINEKAKYNELKNQTQKGIIK